MKKINLLLTLSLSLACYTTANAQLIARWDTNSTNSTGPSGADFDGEAFTNNGSGHDEYSLTTGVSDNDGIQDPGTTGTGPYGSLFSYLNGTGPGATQGRWEDAVMSVNVQSLPSGERMTVQPIAPNSATAHDFLDNTLGGSEGHQINLGRNTSLDSLVNQFYVEGQFTAGSLKSGAGGSNFGILLGYDHSIGGSSASSSISEGYKLGVSSTGVHFTSFGIVDAKWNTALSTGTQYTVRFELTDNGSQTNIEAFLDSGSGLVSLGTQTHNDINTVSTLDTVNDSQHDVAHLNDWYIASGGTGQYFDGTIDYVEVGIIPVPEPSSALLLSLAGFGMLCRRKR